MVAVWPLDQRAELVKGAVMHPYVLVPMLVAAGVFAGTRWLVREVSRKASEAARVAEDLQRRANAAARVPRDLGTLEFDPVTQVYRPKHRA